MTTNSTDWQEFIQDYHQDIKDYYLSYHQNTIRNFEDTHLRDKGVAPSPNKTAIDRKNKGRITFLLRTYADDNDIGLCVFCEDAPAYVLKPNTTYANVIDFDLDTISICKTCRMSYNHKIKSGIWYIGTKEQAIRWWVENTNNTIPNWAIAKILGYTVPVIGKVIGSRLNHYVRKSTTNIKKSSTWYLSEDVRVRMEVLATKRSVPLNRVLDSVVSFAEAHETLDDLIESINNGETTYFIPSHIDTISDGIYYDNRTHEYVRYNLDTKEFVVDKLAQFLQEELGNSYSHFWENLK